MDTIEKAIKELIAKAASAEKSDDAMRFSQAALNAANSAITLANMQRDSK